MRRLSRTAVVFVALTAVACAIDRSGGGEALSGASAGSSPGGSGENGGSAGSAGDVSIVGAAGVFGVATGNAGGASGASNQDHEGGTSSAVDSGSVEPDHTGTVDPVDATVVVEASTPIDASSISSCALHPGGETFTPNGAVSAHCYWPRAATSTWQSAVDACKNEGGHLATLTSAAENTFVVKLIPNFGTDDRLWLGGTDNKSPTDESGGGPYVWITGEPFTYAPWAAMNPDGACANTCNGQRCCQHRVCADRGGVFWDREEGELYYSVCESEP